MSCFSRGCKAIPCFLVWPPPIGRIEPKLACGPHGMRTAELLGPTAFIEELDNGVGKQTGHRPGGES